jgi:deoxyribose-phosphate aldolase
MKVLVINAGSSSLKYQLIEMDNEQVICKGNCERIGAGGFITHSVTGGAKVEDVRLMRETVGPEMGVKASGGVRTKADAEAMIEAGASRIGASSSKKIIEG